MRDRGSAAVEAAIVFPGLLTLGLFLFGAMQVMTARSQVQAAARSAARAAATAGNGSDAVSRAKQSVSSTLAQGSSCGDSAQVDVGSFAPGQSISVTVSCTADTVFSFVIGPKPVTGRASEYVSGILGGTQ